MGKRVFVSYSPKDKAVADAVCAALEQAGVICWIAPRDLYAGDRSDAGAARAIAACEAAVVVFSSASNSWPEAAREVELAAASRRPLILVRIEDAAPTGDLQVALASRRGVDAYPESIGAYLPAIVQRVQGVLAEERGAWTRFRRRIVHDRAAQLALAAPVGVVALMAAAVLIWPPTDAMRSPMMGRWRAELAAGGDAKADCIVEIQKLGQANFADTCPAPLMGASGNVNAVKGGAFAPQHYREGRDAGTFLFQGGAGDLAGAYWVGGGRLRTRDDRFGEVIWRRVSPGGPKPAAAGKLG